MKQSITNKLLKRLGFQVLGTGKDLEVVGLKEIKVLRTILSYFFFLLLFWGLYRLLFKLPENIEELILKPLIWLGSLAWVVKKIEKEPLASLGLSTKGLFKSLYLGIGFGFLFALEGLLANILKYGQLNLVDLSYSGWGFVIAFLISFITAISEELVFRGFIFNRLWGIWKKEWLTNLVVSCAFTIIHLPIAIFILHYGPGQLLAYSVIVFIYSLGAGFVFARTKTIIASILLHVFWTWPVMLFR